MKLKGTTSSLIIYEIRNVAGNLFVPFFGIVFPILMSFILAKGMTADAPEKLIPQINTGIFITLSLIIPMAVIFLGYSASYSQEIENEIPLRMRLFGFKEKNVIIAKIIAQAAVMTMAILIYVVMDFLILDIQLPRVSSAIILILCLYILGGIFFILAHGLANIFKKFGPTYAIAMIIYFGIMIISGMMGISTDNLPEVLKTLAYTLPMSYISSDFIDFWQKGSYNFMPLIQAFIFFFAIACIVLIFSMYKNKRVIR